MRKLAAIMFTDIVGYTALMSQDEEKALHLLQKNRALLKPIIEQFRGEWLKEIGDGTLSCFASAVDAVNCALVIQRTLKDDPDLSLRIGIHVGDVVFEEGDVFGDGVNVASRIEPLAEPGCICVTEQVYDAIRNKPGIETAFLGEKTLKGVDRPVKVYAVTEIRAPLAEATPPVPRPLSRRWLVGAVAALGVAAAASLAVIVLLSLLRGPGPEDEAEAEPLLGAKSIAVLPFVNFSDSKDDEYFSDGITDDILTHLSKIGDLRVIARTSVMQYKNTEKRIRDIGRELGVAAILEGSVRRADSRVCITSQLVDAKTEEHLWAETYDRDLTDIFAIQSDVARKIASALKAALSPDERERIESRPTENLEAYDYYLKGNYYWDNYIDLEGNEKAARMYEKAVELDPEFALAYARLAIVHFALYSHIAWDHSPERLQKGKTALEKAEELSPDLPEVHHARGAYYDIVPSDYDRALEQYEIVLQKQPNNSEIITSIGWIFMSRGEWDQAEAYLLKAHDLDPQSSVSCYQKSWFYSVLRNWTEVVRWANLAISIDPVLGPYGRKAYAYIDGYGNLARAQEVLEEAEKNTNERYTDLQWWIALYSRNYQEALQVLASDTTAPYYWEKGVTFSLLEKEAEAAANFDALRAQYEELVKGEPDYALYHSILGRAYAGLGLKDAAIREGQKAVELLPVSKSAWRGAKWLQSLAHIYILVGEYDRAIDQLEYLLSIPGKVSIWQLKLAPIYDPLREHPRFQALVSGY